MTRITGEWLRAPATARIMAMLLDAGHAAHFVGGCVRNALLGQPVDDIDIATDARPGTVMELAARAGLKAVATGLRHGTVTVIAQGRAHEITTYRQDVETDGRHAQVRFADSLQEDARRRDFTMNALYAEPDGRVIDPLGGLADLRARRVRFIGDAAARIREDHLRILRFFRFHAWYGDPRRKPDAEALAAIAAGLDGLARLSRERVGAETRKLLAAPDPASACATMQRVGVLARIMPGADSRALAPLVQLETAIPPEPIPPEPIRRLAALGGQDLPRALRLSRTEARRLRLLQELTDAGTRPEEIAYRHGAQSAIDVALLRAALHGQPLPDGLARHAKRAAGQVFPLRASDLADRYRGPALGRALREAEQRWIDSGFRLSRDALLAES